MSTLWIGSRKGLFRCTKSGNGWDCQMVAFAGVPVTMILTDPADGILYCALAHGHFGAKFHRSDDSGREWKELPVPSFSDLKDPLILNQIWSMAIGANEKNEPRLWAGTIPAALFYSDDRGESWIRNRPLWELPEREKWFGGGFDEAGIHSICVDPRNQQHLTIGISCGGIWSSRDSGQSWNVTSKGLWAAYMPEDRREDPIIQDPHRVMRCQGAPDHLWIQHHNGIFRSTDNSESWNEISRDFGFAVALHPDNPDKAWFAPAEADSCRIPQGGQFVVRHTRNGGKTFEIQRNGLPQTPAYDLIYRHAFVMDPEGKFLGMGSTTGNLWISENEGEAWNLISGHLPPIACLHWQEQ